jgi:nucleotide-binding universal stress UspA family protein
MSRALVVDFPTALGEPGAGDGQTFAEARAMAMKSILVSVEESDLLDSVLTTALLAAQRFGSALEGLCPRSSMGAFVVAEGMSAATTSALESFELEEQERARRASELFRRFVQDSGVAWGVPEQPAEAVSAGWIDDLPPGDEAVAQHGRLYDLIVAGRPLREAPVPRASTLEAFVFESGRPVLIAPPTPPEALGEVIVVAWNGSTESARAIALATPFLAQARKVHVLAVEGGSVPGPNAGEVAAHLARNGIAAEATGVRLEGRSIGEAILAETASLGADLLVKGAYTHSRLRQMIFGGATSHILAEADLPVLMAH